MTRNVFRIVVAMVVSFPATPVVAQLPSATVPEGLGVNVHFFGGARPDLDMIQTSGVKFIRKDIVWGDVEDTLGHYNWSEPDGLSEDCAARGIRILYCLTYGNSLYGADPSSPTWRQGFSNFAAAAADRFKGKGNIYEIWNEPNSDVFWPGTPSPNQYMALASQVIPAMRAADPNSTIVAPALASINQASSLNYLKSCFQQGLLNLVDGVSVHPYQISENGPEAAVAQYATVRSLMQICGGKTVPIVSSEMGYSTSSSVITPENQGDYLARMFLVNLSEGIPLSMWYDWKNDGNDPDDWEHNYGTVQTDLTPKPAYQEMQLLTRSLSGTTFFAKLPSTTPSWLHPEDDWLLEFTSPGGRKTLAAWTTGDPRAVTVSGWGTLNLTNTPFYVNPIPEPNTLTLCAASAAGIAIYTWLRKRSSP